jgi:hypothetical protein
MKNRLLRQKKKTKLDQQQQNETAKLSQQEKNTAEWNNTTFTKSPNYDIYKNRLQSMQYFSSLYKNLEDVISALNMNSIQYWATGGTLLGAIRHRGIMPWDDDIDISIFSKDVPVLISKVKKILESKGYKFVIRKKDLFFKIIKDVPNSSPAQIATVDIFISSIRLAPGNKQRIAFAIGWFGNQWFTNDELFPLKSVPFGGYTIKTANAAATHLTRVYPNWKTHAVLFPRHGHKEAYLAPFALHPLDRAPAPFKRS